MPLNPAQFHIQRYSPGKLLLFERISIMKLKGRCYPLNDKSVWRTAWFTGKDFERPLVLYFCPSPYCSANLHKSFLILFFPEWHISNFGPAIISIRCMVGTAKWRVCFSTGIRWLFTTEMFLGMVVMIFFFLN